MKDSFSVRPPQSRRWCRVILGWLGLLVWSGCQPASGVDPDGSNRAAARSVARTIATESLRFEVSSPAAARALYLALKQAGIQPLRLTDLTNRLRWPREAFGFTDLAVVARHHGVTLRPYPGSFASWLDRQPAGLVFLRHENRPDVIEPWVRSRGFAGTGPERDSVRLVHPVGGARTWTGSALQSAWCGAAVVDVTDRKTRAARADGPDLVRDEIARYFGEVTKGARLAHVFRLRNGGNRPLRIQAIKTTCGCAGGLIRRAGTGDRVRAVSYPEWPEAAVWSQGIARGADVGREAILPGATAELLLVFDTSHRGDDQRVSAEILSNDPDEPVVRLHLEGRVVRRYRVEPDLLFFRETDADERPVMHCRVSSVSGVPFRLTDLRTTSPFLTAVNETGERPTRAAYRLRVGLEPGRPPGAFTGHVCFRAGGHPMAVTVAARVRGVVKVEPRAFGLGRVRRGAAAEARVLVRGPGAVFQVLGITVDRDDMTVLREPAGPGAYRLTLRVKPGWQAPDLRATVTVETGDVRQPRVAIPVEGFVPRR